MRRFSKAIMRTCEKYLTRGRMRSVLLGAVGALLLAAVACGTSIPTQNPPTSLGSPTQWPTSTPSVAPEAGFAVPEVTIEPESTPDISATVQAMVSATLEVQPTQTPLPTNAPAPTATPAPETPTPAPQENLATPKIQEVQIPTAEPETEDSTAPDIPESARPADNTTIDGNEEGQTTAGPVTEEPETRPTPAPLPAIPTATAEPEPTERPEPTEPPRVGSRGNPISLGDAGPVQDFRTTWEISVVDITPDAWPIIREENQLNKPPDPGKQFYLLRLRAKNVGDQESFFVDYVKTTGEAMGWGYTTSGDSCGVYPGSNSREVFPGGQFELNVCWHVATDDIPTLLMYWDQWPTPATVWFNLR